MALGGTLPPVVAVLTADLTSFSKKMAEARGEMTATKDAGSSAFSGLASASKTALIGTGVILAGVGIASLKMAGDFQQSMTALVTGAGESEKNLGMVSDGILKMAVDTGTSTKQLADGMYMIESAGFHGAAGLDVLKAAAEGAKVGNAALGSVANAVTSGLNAYGLAGDQATAVTNTLIATVAAGKMHMEDLAGSIGNILPVAATAHVNLAEVGAAMATMTSMGIGADQAATFLRQTLLSLEAPGSKAKAALAGIGLSSTDVSQELSRQPDGLIQTLRTVSEHLSMKFPADAGIATAEMAKVKSGSETMDEALANLANNTSPAYVAAVKDIAGGSKTMQGELLLTGAHLGTLQGNFDSITGAVKNSGGAINGWDKVTGDLNFTLDQMKEVVETTAIKIGLVLLPVATRFLGWILSTGPALQHLADWIGKNVVPGLQKFADVVKVLSEWIGEHLMGPLLKFGSWLKETHPEVLAALVGGVLVAAVAALTLGMWMLASAVIAATWPFIAIGLAAAAVGLAVYELITHFSQIVDWLKAHWVDILLVVTGPLGLIIVAFKNFGPQILAALGKLLTLLEPIGKDLMTGLWNGVVYVWNNLASWLKTLGSLALTAIGALGTVLLQLGKDLLQGLWDGVQYGWGNLAGWLGTIAVLAVKAIGLLITVYLQLGKDLLQGLWNGALYIWGHIGDWLTTLATLAVKAIGLLITVLYQLGVDLMTGLWNGITYVWANIWGWFTGLGALIIRGVGDLGGILVNAGKAIIQGLIDGIGSMLGALAQKVGDAVNTVTFGLAGAIAGSGQPGAINPASVMAGGVPPPISQAGLPNTSLLGGAHAAGGIAEGLSLVGERGPELAYFPRPGASITPADRTAALLGGGGGRAPVTITYHIDARGADPGLEGRLRAMLQAHDAELMRAINAA